MEIEKITLESAIRAVIKPILQEVVSEELKTLAVASGPPAEARELENLRHREYLTAKEVQALYGLNHKTLADWRGQGRGPAYMQDGYVILYRRLDVEAYLRSTRKRTIDQRGQ